MLENLRECVPLYQKHLSKSVRGVALFTRSKICFGAVYCNPNKVNHFTTTLYPRDLLNIPTKLCRVLLFTLSGKYSDTKMGDNLSIRNVEHVNVPSQLCFLPEQLYQVVTVRAGQSSVPAVSRALYLYL